MIRILSLSVALFLSTVMSAYAGFTSPVNGISTSGDYTLDWQGNPMDYGVPASANYGTPLYRLTEQKLNSGVPPVSIPLDYWNISDAVFEDKAPGQYVYTYSERRCTVSGCTYFTPPDGQIIVTVGRDARVINEPTEPATAVGSTPYSAGVNDKGEATIAIPINTPAGPGGMHPQLGLNFNSGGLAGSRYNLTPAGWLGYGWSLTGISTINRCRMGEYDINVYNKPNDPSSGTTTMRPRLQYNDTDSLCIDGSLLKLVAGVHLRVGAQYRTYNESFRLIVIKGTDAAPWFEVRNPNGSVAVYGKAANSKVQKVISPGGTTKTPYFLWSIDTETDTFGNQIYYWYAFKDESFSYQPNKQRTYPDFIQYPSGYVKFTYQMITVAPSTAGLLDDGASAGVDRYRYHFDSGAQLTKVTVNRNNSAGSKTYWLRGTNQTEAEIQRNGLRIGSVQECASVEETSAQTCLPPLSFNWAGNGALEELLLKSMTDSLGAVTEYGYGVVTGYNDLFSQNYTLLVPFPVASLMGNGKGGPTTVVRDVYRSTALTPTQVHRTTYQYYGNGEEGRTGEGFLGFRAIAIHDMESNGLSTYRQFTMRASPITSSMALVAERVYDRSYGAANPVLLSQVEYRRSVAEFSFGGDIKTSLPIVDQITTFSYENGVSTGVSTKVNAYALNHTAKTISTITSTTITGAAVNPVTIPVPAQWGDNVTYVVNPDTVKTTHQKITTLGSSTSATDWRIGYTTREENRFYNGAIGGAGVDSKTQFADYTVKTGTTLVETETRFPNDAEYHLSTTYGYSATGLPASVTMSGRHVDSRTTTTVYNLISNTVPVSVVNAYGHTQTNSNFDTRFGLPRMVTDENGLMSTQEFDAFGRVQATMDVNGAITTQNHVSCATTYCEVVPGKSGSVTPAYYKEIISHIAPKTREYYDTRGRAIRTETEGFSVGEWIRTDVQYDEVGRIYKTSLPYKAGSTAEYVVRTYDNRGRVVNIQQPDGGVVTTNYATEVIVTGENWLKVTTDETVKKANGTVESAMAGKKVSYFNGAGQLVRVIDAKGSTEETITTYEYDALGNVVKTVVDGGTDGSTISTAVYDKAGNRTSLTDPNAGTVTSKYTALGQLRETTDAKGTVTTYTYDKLGRMLTRSNSIDGTHNWSYDPVGAKGLLSSITNNNGYTQTYFYQDTNRAARLSKIETTISVPNIATKTFAETVKYDIYGRVSTTVAPAELPKTGFMSTQTYNERKYPDVLWRNTGLYPLRVTQKMGAFGVEEETLFNTQAKRSYDPKSGRILTIQTTHGSTKIQDLSYQWYSNGSLQTKTNSKSGTAIVDTYTYDAHDRLKTTATATNSTTQRTLTQGYNNLGNVTGNTSTVGSDSQVTGYQYGTTTNAGPHAVSVAIIKGISNTLNYDENGAITHYNAASGSDKFIAYNSMNQPTTITVGASLADTNSIARDEFRYSPDGARYYKKSTYLQNGVQRTEHTFYVGSHEVTFYSAGSAVTQSEKTVLGNFLFTRKTLSSGSVVETQEYLHRDHLGSVDAVTTNTGALVANLAFEPYGLRRNSSTFTGNISSVQLTELFTKNADLPSAGYTGHESLDRTGFIHMNGRVYDPQLARFLSPDPLVQAPTNSQSWNRYSYVFNNPLKYIDPTGYEGCSAEADACGKPDDGCGEKCQRERTWYFSNAEAINAQNARWENFGGMMYNVANTHGQLLLGMAQGIAITQAHIPAGGGSKTNTNNVLGVLAMVSTGGGGGFWSNPGAYLPSVPQSVMDFAGGLGDTILFGFGDDIRNSWGIDGGIDSSSDAYSYGEWTGVAVTTATGGFGGLRAAGAKGAGKEFSHWIPNRMGGPRTRLNGNFVSSAKHALSDPYRYRFMSRTWKEANPPMNSLMAQWTRIPYVYKGAAAGGTYGSMGAQ